MQFKFKKKKLGITVFSIVLNQLIRVVSVGAGVSTRKAKSTMPNGTKKDDSANENAISPDGSDDKEVRRMQAGENSNETVDGEDKDKDKGTANATAPIDEEFFTPVATARHRKPRRDTPDSSTSSTSNNADDQVATTVNLDIQ